MNWSRMSSTSCACGIPERTDKRHLQVSSARSFQLRNDETSPPCRKRGRIVLVGVIGLELSRADFFEKELTFQVSCSYGPGRYDTNYEEKGQDYPVGFVRWTEQRNFEAPSPVQCAACAFDGACLLLPSQRFFRNLTLQFCLDKSELQ